MYAPLVIARGQDSQTQIFCYNGSLLHQNDPRLLGHVGSGYVEAGYFGPSARALRSAKSSV